MERQEGTLPLVVVAGPTASGKTALAVELALRFGGEVVSADSMQVYRRMDIATAKPDEAEMRGVPHHLIDFIEPDDAAFSVADYARLAHAAIGEIAARGKLPILAGGTGLYIGAVVDNLDYGDIPASPEIREELRRRAQERGGAAMLEELRAVDPALAYRLHPNNLGRVLRALEVYRTTGIPMSEHQRRSRLTPARYELCMLGIGFHDRAKLYERIDRRVDEMMARGLLDEAREISRLYGGTARQAIGYKELQPYLDGVAPLEESVARLKQATRNYAKRQLTWFRRDERVRWLYADEFSSSAGLAQKASELVHNSKIL